MSILTIKGGARRYTITTDTAGLTGWPFLELGPAGTTAFASVMMIQFTPTVTFAGSFAVLGRTLGSAANEVDVPFVAIPYRRVSLADVASDYTMVSDVISTSALIQVPANGLSVALLSSITAGQMTITSWGLEGSSAV